MALSPMMQQYMQTKEQYKDCLLFYRLGDFYEMFFDDAIAASKVLDLTLTGRNCGLEERAPMCGVPYHAVDTYIAKLIDNGFKVAICEQLTAPEQGKIVARDVVRVITPGTVIESSMLDEKKNNYIASIFKTKAQVGVAYCDITTGEFVVSQCEEDYMSNLNDILVRIRPSEIICNEETLQINQNLACVKLNIMPKFQPYYEYAYDYDTACDTIKKQLNISSLVGHDYAKLDNAICASGALIRYILETQKRTLNSINKITVEKNNEFLYMDIATCRNLELTETIRDQKKKGSILWLLDNTKTSMGARLLRSWVLQPLTNQTKINDRLDAVEELVKNPILLNDITSVINNISDIQRLTGKISYGSIMPRDCLMLKNSLINIPDVNHLIRSLKSKLTSNLLVDIDKINELTDFLQKAIDEDAPNVISGGGFIKEGFNTELDQLKNVSQEGQKWLTALEATEREQTGIKNLKIGYTRVFGYYIEVSKAQQDQIPFRYQRKQTVANHERYITEELKQIEEKILNSEELSIKLEQQIYTQAKEYMQTLVSDLQKVSTDIAVLDCLCSLAQVAIKHNYIKPTINNDIKTINIKDGRHPVVEALLKDDQFIPNDCYLDTKQDRTLIITGPNMAGKSTYMRQVAVITLLAHIGSFVPAEKAEISITDRIFTRIGATDDLAYGQSTFMVEMIEVANIINNATKDSLLILDEVGRGTSTFDGLSIAWAVLEYITNNIKAKTLFATHYHEITDLEGQLDGVKNYRISVKEYNNKVIFLRKIVRGGANKSFGIEVASLAGINENVIKRAQEILYTLEEKDLCHDSKLFDASAPKQSNYNYNEIINSLKDTDMNTVSPLIAFEILNDLVQKAKKE